MFPGPMLLSIKQSQFRTSVPEGSRGALCEAVSTPYGFGYRKSRFQPGIHIHVEIFNAHFENFSLSSDVKSFARWNTGNMVSRGRDIPHY